MEIIEKKFGKYLNHDITEIIVTNDHGLSAHFLSLGARINQLFVPQKDGRKVNVILGHASLSHLLENRTFYGAMIGRVAGRIARGEATINNQSYRFIKNDNGTNHLHGGLGSFDLVNWAYTIEQTDNEVHITFTHQDLNGTNGYPGNLDVNVKYTITNQNEWKINVIANTDEATLFNPTNHVYFNLNGDNRDTILNHRFQLNADYYIPLQSDSIPFGHVERVDNSPFDLRNGVIFSELLTPEHLSHPQFSLWNGFDHPFVLNSIHSESGQFSCDATSISLTMTTDLPNVVIYTHNFPFDALQVDGRDITAYSGFTLETQFEPDAVHHDKFSNIELTPEDTYHHTTTFTFAW